MQISGMPQTYKEYPEQVKPWKKRIAEGHYIITPSLMFTGHVSGFSLSGTPIPAMRQSAIQFDSLMTALFAGNATMEDIESHLRSAFQIMFDENIREGRISGTDSDENGFMISRAFISLHQMITNATRDANIREGEMLAQQHELPLRGAHWLHYNSDFYFFEKELTETLLRVANEFLEKKGAESTDIKQEWRNFYGNGSPPNFNTWWSGFFFNVDSRHLYGKIRDMTTTPARGFRIFLGDFEKPIHTNRREGRFLSIYEFTGITTRRRVMILNKEIVKDDGTIKQGEFSLVEFWKNRVHVDNSVWNFLGNFDIFKRSMNLSLVSHLPRTDASNQSDINDIVAERAEERKRLEELQREFNANVKAANAYDKNNLYLSEF